MKVFFSAIMIKFSNLKNKKFPVQFETYLCARSESTHALIIILSKRRWILNASFPVYNINSIQNLWLNIEYTLSARLRICCVYPLERIKTPQCKSRLTLFGGVFSWCNGWSDGLRNRSTRVRTPLALLRSLSGKYPWERYEPPYPSSYGLNSTVLLEEWLWH